MSKNGKKDMTDSESLSTPQEQTPSEVPVKTEVMTPVAINPSVLFDPVGNALKEVGAVNVFVAGDPQIQDYLTSLGYPTIKSAADADVCIGAVAFDELKLGTYCLHDKQPEGFNLIRSYGTFNIYRKVR